METVDTSASMSRAEELNRILDAVAQVKTELEDRCSCLRNTLQQENSRGCSAAGDMEETKEKLEKANVDLDSSVLSDIISELEGAMETVSDTANEIDSADDDVRSYSRAMINMLAKIIEKLTEYKEHSPEKEVYEQSIAKPIAYKNARNMHMLLRVLGFKVSYRALSAGYEVSIGLRDGNTYIATTTLELGTFFAEMFYTERPVL